MSDSNIEQNNQTESTLQEQEYQTSFQNSEIQEGQQQEQSQISENQQDQNQEENQDQNNDNQEQQQQQQEKEEEEEEQQKQEQEQEQRSYKNSMDQTNSIGDRQSAEQDQVQDLQKGLDQYKQKGSYQSESNEIIVYVVDPVVKDNMRNYVVYTVKGQDKNGSFEIVRRFSDFYALKATLTQRWPGCYVPPTPAKKAVGNFDHQFVEDRRKQLEYYMIKLSEIPHLWYSEEMLVFLRGGSNNIEAALQTLPKLSYESIIKKYEQTFSHLSGKEINTDVIIKISSFSNFLKQMIPTLENYKNICKTMLKERENHNKQLYVFQSFMLKDYENVSISEYLDQDTENKLIFADQESDQLSELDLKLKEFINANKISEIYYAMRYELRELESFQETLQVRQNLESSKVKAIKKKQELNEELNDLMSNKTTMKGIFSSKNKGEQIESVQRRIESEDRNIGNLTLICEIMTVILGYVEIDNFRKEKESKYYETIKIIANHEYEFQKINMEFWNIIQENPNLQ